MKKILARVQARQGETLVEAMAAILIFTLSSIFLFSMLSTAARINKAAQFSAQAQCEELRYAELGADAPDAVCQPSEIRIAMDGEIIAVLPAEVYQMPGTENALYSYFAP